MQKQDSFWRRMMLVSALLASIVATQGCDYFVPLHLQVREGRGSAMSLVTAAEAAVAEGRPLPDAAFRIWYGEPDRSRGETIIEGTTGADGKVGPGAFRAGPPPFIMPRLSFSCMHDGFEPLFGIYPPWRFSEDKLVLVYLQPEDE